MATDKKGTVLIVDDEAANLGVLFEHLRQADFKVLAAEDGQSALRGLSRVIPDIALLDINLPDIDGFELCRLLKERCNSDIPVIFLTGLTDIRGRLRGLNLSAVDYITKPFYPEEVVARVKKHLMIRNLQKALQEKNIELEQEVIERRRIEQELIQAKEAAESANKAKSSFLAGMSHELRTPLNGILGYAQLLRRDPDLSETHRDYAGVIEHSGRHLLGLINDILDIAKIEAQKTELAESEVGLTSFLREIAGMIRVKAEQKGLIFRYEAAPDLPKIIRADEKRLRQILLNLLGNAVKFTEKGEVRMTVQSAKCEVRNDLPDNFALCTLNFAISDTGIGIPGDQQENIFSPFTQIHAGRVEGTGLGLTISRKLVNLMGGELSVSSNTGQGSTFSFELSFAEAGSPKLGDDADARHIVGYTTEKGMKLKILIADDVPDNRAFLVYLLAPLGFDITEAASGRECVEKAMLCKPDLILTDIVMPDMNGIEAIQKIRQDAELILTPIIAVSASTYIEEQSCEAGCDDFLLKPIIIDDLLNMLHRYLHLKWVYAENSVSQASVSEIIPPDPEKSEELLRFANMGNISELVREAEKLARNDPKLQAFASELTRLTQAFDMKQIRVFLSEWSNAGEKHGAAAVNPTEKRDSVSER